MAALVRRTSDAYRRVAGNFGRDRPRRVCRGTDCGAGASGRPRRRRWPGAGSRRRRAAGAAARRATSRAVAGRRSGGARSGAGAVGEPLHRLPWLAGARFGHRSQHHPDEGGEFRSQRGPDGQRPRTVPQSRPPDAEQEAERLVHRRGSGGSGELPAPAGQRHHARIAVVHSRRHRHWRCQSGRGVLQRRRELCHLPQRDGAQPGGRVDAHS